MTWIDTAPVSSAKLLMEGLDDQYRILPVAWRILSDQTRSLMCSLKHEVVIFRCFCYCCPSVYRLIDCTLFEKKALTVQMFGPKTLSISNQLRLLFGTTTWRRWMQFLTCCFRWAREVCKTLKNVGNCRGIAKLQVKLPRRYKKQRVTQLLVCSVTIENFPSPPIESGEIAWAKRYVTDKLNNLPVDNQPQWVSTIDGQQDQG